MAEIIVALDAPRASDALALVDRLPGLRWAKVGSVLFTAEGPALVRELRARQVNVFLDLKWHDIPQTVAGVVSSARALEVQLATVHAVGGRAMLEAAVAAAGAELPLVAVTVLTSLGARDLAEVTGRSVADLEGEVVRLAGMAVAAGCAGVVASAREVAALRAVVGNGLVVVPGIRRSGDAVHDQRRVAGPRETAQAGATHLVVGRPVTEAPDPATAYLEFQELARC